MASAYIRLAVHHPCLLLTLMLLLLLPTAYFGVLNFTLSDPEGGQLIRDSTEAEQAHAYSRAAELAMSGFQTEVYESQQTSSLSPLKIYYTAGGTASADAARTTNVLTVANIQRIAALEDELLALSGGSAWEEVCLRNRGDTSCAPLLSAIPYLRHATDEASLRAAIDVMYDTLDGSVGAPLREKASWFFEQALPTSRYESYILRTHVRIGAPIAVGSWYENGEGARFINARDRRSTQARRIMERFLTPAEAHLRAVADAWTAAASSDGLTLLFAQQWLYTREYTGIIVSDLMFTIGSLGCVYVVLCAYTSSPLLALLGMLQILIAFPVTLFLYAVVLRIKLFGVLQAMAIFVILGIGADDVLILTGQLLFQDASLPALERFENAFKAAFSAMLTTSVTTAAAFGMTATILVPTVRYFAVFCALMVAVNFVLVCSLYFAGLVLWDRHLRFGRGASARCCAPRRAVLGEAKGVTPLHRALHGFASAVGTFVVAHRLKVLIGFALVAAPMAGFALTIGDPDVQLANPYWEANSPLGRRWDLEARALRNASSNAGIDLDLVFGIDTIDRTGTDPTSDRDLGVAVFHQTFDYTQPESQEYVLWLCDEMEREAAALSLERVDCFPRQLRAWRLARREAWPVPAGQFVTVAREFMRRDAASGVGRQLGFVVDSDQLTLKFASIRAITNVHFVSVFRVRADLKQRWLDFVASLPSRRTPPATCNAPFLVSRSFLFLTPLSQSRTIAWTSVGASTALSFVVLLIFTRNWRIAALAMITIALIVFTDCGLVHLYGWKMDIFEAVCITILVGFSVDYTVHLGVAYVEAPQHLDADRKARTLHAVSTLGISITGGAASTAGACLFLFPATILFLPKFGQFMLTAIVVAFVFAMGLFSALLATCGPIGAQGDVRKLWRRRTPPAATTSTEMCKLATSTNGTSTHSIGAEDTASVAESVGEEEAAVAKATTGTPNVRRASTSCLVFFVALIVALLGGAIAVQYAPTSSNDDDAATAAATGRHMPTFDELPEGVWHEMRPAGNTICSRGTPYAFFVRRGRTDRVVLEFMAGGACWSDKTCGLMQGTFNEDVGFMRQLYGNAADAAVARGGASPPSTAPIGEGSTIPSGIADPAGDYGDWTHVFVPYCTGDLHWGNATVTYQSGVTIEHRGAVNAHAAVEWMQTALPSPERLLVTGCSAGAYASLLWAARLAPFYAPRGTRIVQFADSGMDIVTREFMEDAYPNWNTAAVMPWDIFPPEMRGERTNADIVRSGMGLIDMYRWAAAAYPNCVWSQYSSAYDENQAFYYAAMLDDATYRGEPDRSMKLLWNAKMRSEYSGENATSLLALPNYAHWIGEGDEHCVLPYNRFWWRRATSGEWSSGPLGAGDQSIAEWVAALLRGEVYSIDCALAGGGGVDACQVGLED